MAGKMGVWDSFRCLITLNVSQGFHEEKEGLARFTYPLR